MGSAIGIPPVSNSDNLYHETPIDDSIQHSILSTARCIERCKRFA